MFKENLKSLNNVKYFKEIKRSKSFIKHGRI